VSGRIAVTTIVRGAGLDAPSGWLRVLSTDGWEELAKAPLPDAVHRASDRNPRGGLRGGRGIASTPDALAVALNDRVLVLDRDWRPARVLSHPWMGGVHDVAADAGGVWVTCADNDLLLRLDWDGRLAGHWHWRADRAFRRELGFGWLPPMDRSFDHRNPLDRGLRADLGHVNAVALDGDAVLVGLGLVRAHMPLRWPYLRERGTRLAHRAGLGTAADAAIRLWRRSPFPRIQARFAPPVDLTLVTPGARAIDIGGPGEPGWTWVVAELRREASGGVRPRVMARHEAGAVPAHNVASADAWVVVNESSRGRVVALDRESGAIVRAVRLPGDYPFPRGLLRLADGRFLVGTKSPATLAVVDLAGERVDELVALPDDRDEAPYSIGFVPDSFGDPGQLPASRAEWGIEGADASRAPFAGGCRARGYGLT
jgi:hypothetical protein